MELKLRQTWDLITISDYMNYTCILDDANTNPFEKSLKILALMCGIDESELLPLPASQITPLFEKLEFLKEHPTAPIKDFYEVNGKVYKLCKKVHDITAGQFIDLSHYTKDEKLILDNLHVICATLLLPVVEYKGKKRTNKVEIEKYLQTPIEETSDNLYNNMPITEALGISNFFTLLYAGFTAITKDYLETMKTKEIASVLKMLNENEKSEKLEQSQKQLRETGLTRSGNGSRR